MIYPITVSPGLFLFPDCSLTTLPFPDFPGFKGEWSHCMQMFTTM